LGGLVYTFGKSNENGQLGQGDTTPRSVPSLIISLKNQKEMIKNISCGFRHTIAKTGIGKVFVWGGGDCGQMGTGELNDEFSPKLINTDRLTSLKGNNHTILSKKK
jgi:alpha-tubulin suppressor-like RCC1 family protein